MISKLPYKKIHAFTYKGSNGNPAVVIDIGDLEISEEKMLEIAKEHHSFVSEVIFFSKQHRKIVFKYYSSECEVEFCGHGTIAAMYGIIENDPDLYEKKKISIQTSKKGEIEVYNELSKNDGVYIESPSPIWFDTSIENESLYDALRVSKAAFHDRLPTACIDAGLKTLICPMANLDTLLDVEPDFTKLQEFCYAAGYDIVLIFCEKTECVTAGFHTRVFAPKFGYLEDPATGSGNCALGHYLLAHQLWTNGTLSIEQGKREQKYNQILLKSSKNKVLFGGSCTLRVEGCYYLNQK